MASIRKTGPLLSGIKYYWIFGLFIVNKIGVSDTAPSSSGIAEVNKDCHCVNITECPRILDILDLLDQRGLTSEYYALMSRAICGSDVNHPKVCCESDVEIEKKIIADNKCFGPWGQFGQCVDIYECKSMLRIINQKPLLSMHKRLLQKARCGSMGRRPKVCCNSRPRSTQEDPLTFEDIQDKFTDSCVLPSGEKGNCINIKQCQKTFNILKQRPFTEKNRRLLNSLQCGWEGKYPKMCCESEVPDEGTYIEELHWLNTDNSSLCGDSGKCVDIDECESMWKLMSQERPAMYDKIVAATRCSPRKAPLKVCCKMKSLACDDDKDVHYALIKHNRQERLEQHKLLRKHENLRRLPHDICGPVPEARIVGGNDTNVYEFPWMALLGYDTGRKVIDFRCSGTLINEKYILTAAHCITALPIGARLVKVRIGEYNLRTDEDCDDEGNCVGRYQDFGIQYVRAHKHYTKRTFENDIGLVRLRGAVDFSPANIRPICLPLNPNSFATTNDVPDEAVVTGWGATEFNLKSDKLQKVTLPVLDLELCKKSYRHNKNIKISDRQICAGGTRDRDSCTGDSGGPLQAIGKYGTRPSMVQYGVVSYGPASCGLAGSPGIYTKVSCYVDWILDNMDN